MQFAHSEGAKVVKGPKCVVYKCSSNSNNGHFNVLSKLIIQKKICLNWLKICIGIFYKNQAKMHTKSTFTTILEVNNIKKNNIIKKGIIKFFTNYLKSVAITEFRTFFEVKILEKIFCFSLFCALSLLKWLHKLIYEFVKLIRVKMINTEKYTNLVLKRGLADSQEYAELLVDTLYQLAFTVVQNYLLTRR